MNPTKHLYLFILVVMALGIIVLPISGQEALAYGEQVTGEITSTAFEFEYVFEGSAGDLVVITMKDAVEFGDLDRPEILLLDSGGNMVANTTETFSFSEATLITQLATDDTYTIIATRNDGRSGDSVGPFILDLFQPEVIDAGAKLSSSISSEGNPKYYAVTSPSTFNLNYTRLSGEMSPQLTMYALDSEAPGSTIEVAAVSGQLNTILLGTFDSDTPYIIVVERALFDFHFSEVTAEFNLFVTNP